MNVKLLSVIVLLSPMKKVPADAVNDSPLRPTRFVPLAPVTIKLPPSTMPVLLKVTVPLVLSVLFELKYKSPSNCAVPDAMFIAEVLVANLMAEPALKPVTSSVTKLEVSTALKSAVAAMVTLVLMKVS